MKLEPEQFQELQLALLDAYTTENQLTQMVRLQLNTNLATITKNSNLSQSIFELISWAERTDSLSIFLDGALAGNPGNRTLVDVVNSLRTWLISSAHMANHRNQTGPRSAKKTAGFRYPFGEVACEQEARILQTDYPNFYYSESRFNSFVLDPDRYLVIGRRGSGKTSLIKYCSFQNRLRNSECIAIERPEEFQILWQRLLELVLPYENYGTLAVSNIWEYVLWLLIFDHLEIDTTWLPYIETPAIGATASPESKVFAVIESLLSESSQWTANNFTAWIANVLKSEEFNRQQQEALEIMEERPLIIAIDTVEKYDIHDNTLLQITAALIECASNLNVFYAGSGLHTKVFVSSEIYPYLRESVISNPSKFLRDPVMLHWSQRDLVKLVSWRFYRYLQRIEKVGHYVPLAVNWNDFNDMIHKLWYPFFGETIEHRGFQKENSFSLILRYTQMRPRQVVEICNQIAKQALQQNVFPHFYKLDVLEIVEDSAAMLADEAINSYSRIYPHVGEIVEALRGAPVRFKGNYLDRIARFTRSAWPTHQSYSLAKFRRLVTELGIVGRVRSYDEESRIVAADFEYNVAERLALRDDDDCVIHPMFYSKLQMTDTTELVIYPFLKRQDYIQPIR